MNDVIQQKLKLVEKLSKKERVVINLILVDMKTKDIATHLYLKPNTISTMKKNAFDKLQVNSLLQLFEFMKFDVMNSTKSELVGINA